MALRLSTCIVACLVAMTNGGTISRGGCGTTKACYADPEHCDPMKDECDYFLSYKENTDNTKIDFELVGARTNGEGWVGVGFSNDRSMGSDSGVMCINDASFIYWTFYNRERVNEPNTSPTELSDTSNDVSDGIMSCSFTRLKSVEDDPTFFDLEMNFYLLMGTGPCTSGVCTEHEVLPVASTSKVDFTSTDDISAGSPDHSSSSSSSSSEEENAANDVTSKMSVMAAVMVIAAVVGLFR